jgi:hypothetical protein
VRFSGEAVNSRPNIKLKKTGTVLIPHFHFTVAAQVGKPGDIQGVQLEAKHACQCSILY